MSHAEVTEQGSFVRAIEPLRGFAAISVLIMHVIYLAEWSGFPRTGPLAWFWVGWLGVDIFFVISGFVITMAAFRELANEKDRPRFNFLVRRLARIAPLYFLSLAIYLLVVKSDPVNGSDAWFQVLTHVFFVHNFFPSTTGSINPPTWTIGTEMQLYILVMILMAWLPRFRTWALALAVIGVAIAFRYAAYSANASEPAALLSHFTTQMPGMLDSFGLGMVLATLKQKGRLPMLNWGSWLILLLVAIGGLAACEYILSVSGDAYWKTWRLPTFFRSFAALVCTALVLAAITLPQRIQDAIPRLLIFLGQISYGIYLWHFIVITLLLKYFPMGKVMFLCTTVAITIMMAAASWIFIEKPIVKATQRWLLTKAEQ